jgi:hypothetical protein
MFLFLSNPLRYRTMKLIAPCLFAALVAAAALAPTAAHALNPQPEPPGVTGKQLNPQPEPPGITTDSKAGKVQLNPQPEPPGVTGGTEEKKKLAKLHHHRKHAKSKNTLHGTATSGGGAGKTPPDRSPDVGSSSDEAGAPGSLVGEGNGR